MTNRFTVLLDLPSAGRPACCEDCGAELPVEGAVYLNPDGDPLCWECFKSSVTQAARPGRPAAMEG